MVGSSKRSILYLGKQAESYKVMIYAPPCLREVGAEGEDDRKASPPREIRGSTRERNTGKQSTKMHLLLRSKHKNNREATRDTALRYGSTVESGY